MIKTFYQDDIIDRLAAIISYGLAEGYSYKSIEEHIISSTFINDLENNQYNIESTINRVVESTYKVTLSKNADISFRGLFLAESYIKLFLYYNRSFEYLFLYWPLSYFNERYNIYHEMDFSNLRQDFENQVNKTTLLRKLSIVKQTKLSDIAKLTGININSIDKYSRDDSYLFSASSETIYKLALLFNVKENLFISNLGVYLDQSIYLFDKSNQDYRNYLGLYFANFYDSRINEHDFDYDKQNNRFISKDNSLEIKVIADSLVNIDIDKISNTYNSNTYLIIFPSGYLLGNEADFECLSRLNTFEVMIVSQEYVYMLKKKAKREITDTVNRSLIIRAKNTTRGL